MKKFFKKLTCITLSSVMIMGLSLTAFASEPNNETVTQPNVYSPEFPDAYILIETPLQANTRTANNTVNLDLVTATVFVEEKYSVDENGNAYVSESHLLSKDEVDEVGINNFKELNSFTKSKSATNSYGKLTLTFSGNYSTSGKKVTCNLTGNAVWGFGAFTSSKYNPAVGDDFIGITWSGSFTTSSSSCTATDASGNSVSTRMVDSIANGGRVWEFSDSLFEANYANYAKNINASMTIKKNTKTGNGNTAEAVLKYIHTYQQTVGSINMSAGSDSVSAGFSLSSADKQWTLVATVTGIPY